MRDAVERLLQHWGVLTTTLREGGSRARKNGSERSRFRFAHQEATPADGEAQTLRKV